MTHIRIKRFSARLRGLYLWPMLVAWAGCAGSETGNAQVDRPLQAVAFAMSLSPQSSGLSSTSADGVVVTSEEGFARVISVELRLAPGERCSDDLVEAEAIGAFFHEWCSGGSGLLLEGEWLVDLVTGRFDPPLEGVQLPESMIDEARVTLRGEGEPAFELAGHLDGDRDFELAIPGTVPARFVATSSIAIDDETGLLELDLGFASWFADISLEDCLDSQPAGGIIDLDRGSRCASIGSALRNHLVSRGRLKAGPR